MNLRLTVAITNTVSAVDNNIGNCDSNLTNIDIGSSQLQLQQTTEVLEFKSVVVALGIHGELMDVVLHIGLGSGEGDVLAVGGQRGGIEGMESGVASLARYVIENSSGGILLQSGGIKAAASSAIDGNVVTILPVERVARETCFTVLAGAVLDRGAELSAIGENLLFAGSKGEQGRKYQKT